MSKHNINFVGFYEFYLKKWFKLNEQHRPYLIKFEEIGFNLVQFVTWFVFSIFLSNKYWI